MSKKLTVLVDMDEVIVDLMTTWLINYRAHGGEHVEREDILEYALEGRFKDMIKWWKCIDRFWVLDHAKPLPGAIDALRRLDAMCNVFIVTHARYEAKGHAHEQKLLWLERYAPWFDRDKVIFTRQKHLVRGDVLIEDNIETLRRWKLANHHQGEAFLIDSPWNQSGLGRGSDFQYYRMDSLAEIADILCKQAAA